MKKIILLVSGLVLSFATFAQLNISIQSIGGNHSLNDSTIVVYSPALGTGAHTIDLEVINLSGAPLGVKIKRVELIVVPHTTNYLCWGLCYAYDTNHVWKAPGTQSIPAYDTNTTFTADYTDSSQMGTELIRYVFYSSVNASDTAWVNVKFIISPASVPQIAGNLLHFSAPYPNPSGAYASFNYHVSAEANLIVYNSIGQAMRNIILSPSANKVNLNVADMPSGIYICKVSAEGTEPVFQKLIVAH